MAVLLVGSAGFVYRSDLLSNLGATPAHPAAAGPGPVSTLGEPHVYDTQLSLSSCVAPAATVAPPTARSLDPQVKEIATAVERLRGLQYKEPVKREILTPRGLARRVSSKQGSAGKRHLGFQESFLTAFGLAPPGFDLKTAEKGYMASQVGGFYLPRKKKLVVAARGSYLHPFARVTVAHELEHALADQNMGLPNLNDHSPADDDKMTAERALIEGDATVTMSQYMVGTVTREQMAAIQRDPSVVNAGRKADTVPYIMQRAFEFPYSEGALFVCNLYLDGGWAEVNAAYDNPPTSTAQILFPDRYREHVEPVNPTDPKDLPSQWKSMGTYSVGALDLLSMFVGPTGKPEMAVSGGLELVKRWNGGEIHAWRKGKDTAFVMNLVDGGEEAPQPGEAQISLCGRVQDWYAAAFPNAKLLGTDIATRGVEKSGANFSVLRCTPEGVSLGLTTDRKTAMHWKNTLGVERA